MDRRETVVLVNGLWFGDLTLAPLAARLRRDGFDTRIFSYPSVRLDLRANAGRLHDFILRIPDQPVSFVAFSLGGLVLRAMYHYFGPARGGRVVLLGSPQQGSAVGTAGMKSAFGRWIGGRSLADVVSGRPNRWLWPDVEIGIIAGSRSMGIGRFFAPIQEPNDGAVLVRETELPNARDRIVVPVAHSGLLLSRAVAAQTIRFLRTGRFLKPGR